MVKYLQELNENCRESICQNYLLKVITIVYEVSSEEFFEVYVLPFFLSESIRCRIFDLF